MHEDGSANQDQEESLCKVVHQYETRVRTLSGV